MPIFDAAFLATFPAWNGEQVAMLLRHLWDGQSLLRSGLHLTAEEAKQIDWAKVFPERERMNAAYAKQLRDEVVARHGGAVAE
jgi:hypothetical protein